MPRVNCTQWVRLLTALGAFLLLTTELPAAKGPGAGANPGAGAGHVAGANPGAGAPDAIKPLDTAHQLGGYHLAWHDEFNGDKLNTDQWTYRTGTRFLSVQKPENVSVSGGMLRLALKKEKTGKLDYTAGGVISKRSFENGYYEARFKCPAGKGWHTSFWLDPHGLKTTGAAQEIDICETDSIRHDRYAITVHEWKPRHKGHPSKQIKTPDLSAGFHVWGCEFTAKAARFFFDGKLVSTQDISGFRQDAMNIWLTSIASTLGHTDKVDDNKLPEEVQYDWVRFYEKSPAPSTKPASVQ